MSKPYRSFLWYPEQTIILDRTRRITRRVWFFRRTAEKRLYGFIRLHGENREVVKVALNTWVLA
jgi:hypothetical protein